MHFSAAEGHDELLPLREAQGGGTVSRQKKSAMEGRMAVGAWSKPPAGASVTALFPLENLRQPEGKVISN